MTRNIGTYFCKCLKIFRVKIKKNYISQPVNLSLMQYSLLPTEKEHTKVNWSFHQKSGNFPPIMTESDYPETLGTNFPTKQFLKNAQTWARAFSTLRLAPGIQLLGGHWANPPKFYIYCCVHPRCANAPLDKCIAGQKNIRTHTFPKKSEYLHNSRAFHCWSGWSVCLTFGHIYLALKTRPDIFNASAPIVTGTYFMQRFGLFLGPCQQ